MFIKINGKTKEMELSQFEFWEGGKENANKLSVDMFNRIERYLIDTYGGMKDVALNDLFWFSFIELIYDVGYYEARNDMEQ